MRIIIATVCVPFVRGGAELLASQLEQELVKAGHQTETVQIPFKWYPPERIIDQLLACRLLDISESCGVGVDVMIGLKFPAFHIPHPRKHLWILHQHRQAYDLWENEHASDLRQYPNGYQVRAVIKAADEEFLPQAKKIYTISENVSDRLRRYNGIESTALYHPPPFAADFFSGEGEDYLFCPSRLSALKRQDLIITALARTREPVCIRFAGTPDYPPYLDELKSIAERLGVSHRIEWLGHVNESEKLTHYAHAIGVVFTPIDEDYGYITLESMLAAKPVITCKDSGGPNEFVVDGKTGYVVDASADALARAMDELWSDRARAATLGHAARQHYYDLRISWKTVTDVLASND